MDNKIYCLKKGCVWRAICLFIHSYTTRVSQYNLYETLKLFIYTCYRIENSSATSKGNKTNSQEVKSEELTWYSDAKYGQGLVSCSHLSELSSERKTLISSSWQEIYSNVECLTTGYLACMKQRLIMLYGADMHSPPPPVCCGIQIESTMFESLWNSVLTEWRISHKYICVHVAHLTLIYRNYVTQCAFSLKDTCICPDIINFVPSKTG